MTKNPDGSFTFDMDDSEPTHFILHSTETVDGELFLTMTLYEEPSKRMVARQMIRADKVRA